MNLKQTISALNEVYNLQLSKAETQLGTIELVDNKLNKMAVLLEELNNFYTRMVQAVSQK